MRGDQEQDQSGCYRDRLVRVLIVLDRLAQVEVILLPGREEEAVVVVVPMTAGEPDQVQVQVQVN